MDLEYADEEVLERYLFENTIKGQWDNVVRAFEVNPLAHGAKIFKSGDTALHRAVSDYETEVALRLVKIVDERALAASNEQGNTPLHLASAVGNLELCQAILSKHRQVFLSRNHLGETPIFLSALHGKETVFLFLHGLFQPYFSIGLEDSYFRRIDGDTVLHVAISFEHFRKYGDYNHRVAQKFCGLSPLHILASKPNTFKSSTRLGRLDRIIYNWLVVDDKRGEEIIDDIRTHIESTKREKGISEQYIYQQEKYKTCVSLFGLLKKMIQADGRGRRKFPPNIYASLVLPFKLIVKALLAILVLVFGSWRIKAIHRKKELHFWAKRAMDEMVHSTKSYRFVPKEMENNFREEPEEISDVFLIREEEERRSVHKGKGKRIINEDYSFKHTPILIAAKMGVSEMVEKILDEFPMAIEDLDSDRKNVVLLAIENRQPQVYTLLLQRYPTKRRIFEHLDTEHNTALHMAARISYKWSWHIPRSMVLMHQEIKWYKFVKNSMPPDFFFRQNREGYTPKEIFIMTHRELIRDVNNWLNKISQACSNVAGFVALVTFATTAAIPGGVKLDQGIPTLNDKPAFGVFGLSSVVAFYSSVASLLFFLSVMSSRYHYALDFPLKIFVGFSLLFIAIASMLASFLSGNTFVLNQGIRHVAYLLYSAFCLPLIYLAFKQFSLYLDLLGSIFLRLPKYSQM